MSVLTRMTQIVWGVCGLLLAVSCSEEEGAHPSASGHVMEFTSDGVSSRADADVILDAGYEAFPDGSSMGVFAYTLPNGVFEEDKNTPDLLYNTNLTKLSTGGYLYNPVAHWPASGKVKFAAYYPHSGSLPPGTISVTPYTASGLPEITVDLEKAKSKLDFSVAVLEPIAPTTATTDPADTPTRKDYVVNFRFKRKISELFFRAKVVNIDTLTNLYINAISIKNIYTKGVYKMQDNSWSYSQEVDGVSGATIAFGASGIPVNKTDFTDLISPGNEALDNRETSLAMFPQTYQNMELSIVYTLEYLKSDGGCEYRIIGTKKIPISIEWEAAKMYVYDLEFGFYEITGDKVPFKLTVTDWVKKEIGTTID